MFKANSDIWILRCTKFSIQIQLLWNYLKSLDNDVILFQFHSLLVCSFAVLLYWFEYGSDSQLEQMWEKKLFNMPLLGQLKDEQNKTEKEINILTDV